MRWEKKRGSGPPKPVEKFGSYHRPHRKSSRSFTQGSDIVPIKMDHGAIGDWIGRSSWWKGGPRGGGGVCGHPRRGKEGLLKAGEVTGRMWSVLSARETGAAVIPMLRWLQPVTGTSEETKQAIWHPGPCPQTPASPACGLSFQSLGSSTQAHLAPGIGFIFPQNQEWVDMLYRGALVVPSPNDHFTEFVSAGGLLLLFGYLVNFAIFYIFNKGVSQHSNFLQYILI